MRILRWSLILLLFALAAPAMHAETATKMPAPTGYVDDYAGVFSDSAKSDMDALCTEAHDKTKAQIFVVTIHSLDGASIEQFSNDLFHTWKIGEKKTDRGVLLLIAIQDHKYRYEVGYGLEGILNDAKVGDMGRAMLPDLRAGAAAGGRCSGLLGVTYRKVHPRVASVRLRIGLLWVRRVGHHPSTSRYGNERRRWMVQRR